MTDFKVADDTQQVHGAVYNFNHVTIAVTHGQARDKHVRVTDGFDLHNIHWSYCVNLVFNLLVY